MVKIVLKKGRDQSLKRLHPWVFSGAIARIEGDPYEGEFVCVCSISGDLLGYGHYQTGSIVVRMLSFDNSATVKSFWDNRIAAAYRMREIAGLTSDKSVNCYRLIHGEGDWLPGLVIDYYNGVAVVQAHSAGMYLSVDKIVAALEKLYKSSLKAVYCKSVSTAPRTNELNVKDGYIYGNSNEDHIITENGHLFRVDWEQGQKTGFFLDQRDNRQLVKRHSAGKRVLNLFSYTGGFSVYALSGGAQLVDSVDSSKSACLLAEENTKLNIFNNIITSDARHNVICSDAIYHLKGVSDNEYNMIIVDPPAFAKNRSALKNALRAYQRINSAAISRVAKEGIIFTFSCSQAVERDMFYETIFSAAAHTGRNVRIMERLTQPADHPVNIYHPEGEYLKGLMLYVE